MKQIKILFFALMLVFMGGTFIKSQDHITLPVDLPKDSRGTKENPLRVLLVPTDGGTETGTIAEFSPIFNAISRMTGLNFDLRVTQSYSAVIEGLASKLGDIAFVGPTAYLQAYERGAAEPLAVAVLDGESVYYPAIFGRAGFVLDDLKELRGKRMAFGDVNSSSSFTFQVAMLIDAGLDPARDLDRIYLTGGHATSLGALREGHVDVAAASINSYEKAINDGHIDPAEIVPVALSEPVPYPPFVMHPDLSQELKDVLRYAFNHVHEDPNISPDMIRGFGGILVDRYDSSITHEMFQRAADALDKVSNEVKGEMLRRAADR